MPLSTPVRTSGRKRAPNPRYVPASPDAPEFGDDSGDAGSADVNDDSMQVDDDEFDAEDAEMLEQEAEAEERQEDLEPNEGAASDEEAAATSEDEELQSAEESGKEQGKVESEKQGNGKPRKHGDDWRWKQYTQPVVNHDRGITTRVHVSMQHGLLKYLHGDEDSSSPTSSIQKWGFEITFPTRASSAGSGGLAYPSGFEDGLKNPATLTERPYYQSFADLWEHCSSERQSLPADRAFKYLPRVSTPLQLMIGLSNDQHEFTCKPQEVRPLQSLFPQPHTAGNLEPQSEHTRTGFILNAGSRILSMSWAPTRKGKSQYLAVAVEQKGQLSTAENPFLPNETHPASIQIWRLSQGSGPVSTAGTLGSTNLELVRVICHDWGTTRRLSWSQGVVSAGIKDKDSGHLIGYLATISADGIVRVLEVDEPSEPQDIWSHYKSASFSARPPNSVCTCIDWIGTDELVAGCANGFVAIWNVPQAMKQHSKSPLTDPSATKPWSYHPYSDTYINHVLTSAPAAPYLIHTISVSGHQQLTDLRNPAIEFVTSLRSRLYQTSAAFSPHLRCYISTDETGDLVISALRRFFNSRRLAPTHAGPTGGVVVATSPLHCSVLFAGPDGAVSCTNPNRRLQNTRWQGYAQKWFVHEWRQAAPESRPSGAPDKKDDVKAGTVRMSEGYKVEDVIEKGGNQRSGQAVYIFEPEQAVTALAWNPNVEYGGWAAAGMGSGLIRLEDVMV